MLEKIEESFSHCEKLAKHCEKHSVALHWLESRTSLAAKASVTFVEL